MRVETQVGIFILSALGLFLYLSINIKAIRLDKNQYHEYKTYFDDTGGIAPKTAIKIAGVDVGWVEEIKLLNGGKAEVILRISRKNKLAKNAFAMIHQDGLIGTKSVEIDPGDPSTGILLPGSVLSMPGRTPASVGELLEQFRTIATTVQDITTSLKNVVATRQGEENMRQTLASVSKATDRMADFSLVLQRSMERNESRINSLIDHMNLSAQHLSTGIPAVTNDIHHVSKTIVTETKRVGSAFEEVGKASGEATGTFKHAGQVMEKLNNGKGVLGKLINEDETYSDIRKTVHGIKEYVNKGQSFVFNVDMHSETMPATSDQKGYFELRLRTNSDCFYVLQLVSDKYGSIRRENTQYVYRDDTGTEMLPSSLPLEPWARVWLASEVDKTVRVQNDVLFGLQFGKRFDRLALRIGLFENTFGFGCDFSVPLNTDKMHWITSFEAFDFSGINRLNDTRPHLKWLNKLYFMRNIYTTFGIDDFYSRTMATPFFGAGLRFGDDDLKYFTSMLPALSKKS